MDPIAERYSNACDDLQFNPSSVTAHEFMKALDEIKNDGRCTPEQEEGALRHMCQILKQAKKLQ